MLAEADCLDLFALNVSTVFLFRNVVSFKEKPFALCSQVARTTICDSHHYLTPNKKDLIKRSFYLGRGGLSWICSTLTEFCFRYFVPVNKICSLSGINAVRKSARTTKRCFSSYLLEIKKRR